MSLIESLWLVAAATVASLVLFKAFLVRNEKDGSSAAHPRRRTSLASLMGVDRSLMAKHMAMRQNVVNAVLCFERGEAPSRGDMATAMAALASRFERMRSRPRMSPDGKRCEWAPIDDLDAAIEGAISEDSVEADAGMSDEDLERAVLEKVAKYAAEILPTDPAWRVIILKPSAVLVRIDHCIGDGLTLVTLLKEIGTRTDGNKPLRLSDLSPLLRRFESLGDWKISLLPLKLLWPPRLRRAFSLLQAGTSGPEERFNPLRPPKEHFMEVIPPECYGTVYFPTFPLAAIKALARAAGATVNDVVLFCFADAVGRYFSQIGSEDRLESIRLLLPIANPIRPSLYGDEYAGLCNHMTPVVVPLDISDRARANPSEALGEIRRFMDKVKKSDTPLLLNTLNTIFDRVVPLEKMLLGAEAAFKRVSCVYSNVPGPTEGVSVSDRRLRKIQVIMPHPTSIFQVLSYDGKVFCNITLDVRTARKSWLLRDAFVRAVRDFAVNFGPVPGSIRAQIDEVAQSGEWGGNGLVFTCGDGE